MGKAYALKCDEDFMNEIRYLCQQNLTDLKLPQKNLSPLGGSDDFSYMMEYVQSHGGKATLRGIECKFKIQLAAESSAFLPNCGDSAAWVDTP